MAKLYFKDKPVIGLDIGLTGIKVMAIDQNKPRVLGYGSLDVDPLRMRQVFDNQDQTYLLENLQSLMRDKIVGNLSSNHAAISVPTARTFSRTFNLPKNQEKNLKSAVEMEVHQYIPIPSEALYVDYDIIERKGDTLTVIMSAVPRNLVDLCVESAVSAGLRPVLVEPSVNAIARLLGMVEGSNKLATIVIDIGSTSTDIAVLETGSIRVTGGAAIGGNILTVAISEEFNLPLEQAHHLKITSGLSNGPRRIKIKKALQPHLDQIVTQVKKVERYYHERLDDNRRIEQVIIVGAGSDVPSIGDYFTNELMLPARVASPWQDLDFGKLPSPHKQFRPRYITVAGLASLKKELILP